ncbi:MAG: iron chelate uptake ABC transporter family permease subunit [Bacilli bacterium]
MKRPLKKLWVRFLLASVISLGLMLFILLFGLTSKNFSFFFPRRLDRVFAFVLVSFAISYSTISFQTMTSNRLLTPSIMGLDALYLFIQTVIVFFFGSGKIEMLNGINNYLLSIIIMIGFSLILFTLLFKKENNSIYFLLLVGMIMGSFFGGLSTFMQSILDPNEFLLVQGKMFASFNSINTELLIISFVIIAIVLLSTLTDYKKLDVLSLGKDQAVSLGIDYKKLVFKNLIAISILTSVATALVGPVTFLGLIIASLSSYVFKSYKHHIRIIGATLISLIFLGFAVIVIERVFNFQTTVSVIINLIGGLYFIFLILKEAKK